ncbi:MAG: redoxin domain-containing protein [Cytophagales bacterium]|nr:redoxin domain-containing protein [Cytophagales bacterium]
MKYHILAALLFINAFSAFSKGIKIKGELSNASEYQYVYLYQYLGSEFLKYDSTALKEGKFLFKYKNRLPRGFYRLGVSDKLSFKLIIGQENMSIRADVKDISNSINITGSKEYPLYEQYQTHFDNYNSELKKINQQVDKLNIFKLNKPELYKSRMKILDKQLDSLNEMLNQFFLTLSKNDDGLFMSKTGAFLYTPDNTTKEIFFTNIDLTDEELLRGDMLQQKVDVYLVQFIEKEKWKDETDNILNLAKGGSKSREAIYSGLVNIYRNVEEDYARKLAKTYCSEYPKSAIAKKVLASLPKGQPEVGEVAPEITLPDLDGKMVSLSSTRGKVVLLDFWASWCAPCRKSNPEIVKIYQKFKDKGFTVFGVSLDNRKVMWEKAIKKQKLTWINVSDLKGRQNAAARLYKIFKTPATFLLDEKGVIVAKNLHKEELGEKIESLLKK